MWKFDVRGPKIPDEFGALGEVRRAPATKWLAGEAKPKLNFTIKLHRISRKLHMRMHSYEFVHYGFQPLSCPGFGHLVAKISTIHGTASNVLFAKGWIQKLVLSQKYVSARGARPAFGGGFAFGMNREKLDILKRCVCTHTSRRVVAGIVDKKTPIQMIFQGSVGGDEVRMHSYELVWRLEAG